MRKLIYIGSLGAFIAFGTACGNSSADTKKTTTPGDAKTYFTEHLGKMSQLISKSFPDKSDCQAVFKGSDADVYLNFVKQMAKEGDMGVDENYSEIGINTFTTKDLINETPNDAYTGGMLRIKDKLQPDVTFYQVEMKNKNDNGTSLNYWVWVNGHWAFFMKPWRAFRDID